MRRQKVPKSVAGFKKFGAIPRSVSASAARSNIAGRVSRLWLVLDHMANTETTRALIDGTLCHDPSAAFRCEIDTLIITDLRVTDQFPGDIVLPSRFNGHGELCAGVRWKFSEKTFGQVIGRTRVNDGKPPIVEYAAVPARLVEEFPSFYRFHRPPDHRRA